MAAQQITNLEAASSVRTKLNHLLLGGVSIGHSLASGASTITPTARLVTITGTAVSGFDITIANGTVASETIDIEVGNVTLNGTVRFMDASAVTIVGSIRANHVYRLRWSGTTWLNAGRSLRNINPAAMPPTVAGGTINFGALAMDTFYEFANLAQTDIIDPELVAGGERHGGGGFRVVVTGNGSQINWSGDFISTNPATPLSTALASGQVYSFTGRWNTQLLKCEVIEDGPGSGDVLLRSGGTMTGLLTAVGVRVANGSDVAGALTMAAHSGGVFRTSGTVTVPNTAGFTVTLLAGGAHTVGAGGATHSLALGDIVSVVVVQTGIVRLTKALATNVVTLATAP